MENRHLLKSVEDFYNKKVEELGPTPEGADYNSKEAQEIRFMQFLRLLDSSKRISINDYGCGYGALAFFLLELGYNFEYYGFDISKNMILNAKQIAPEGAGWKFFDDEVQLVRADYTVACGIFNLRFHNESDAWEAYIFDTLNKIFEISEVGFGFNMLTKYSDKERMRPDLYYGDPLFFFDYCKKNFSRNVALLHDYNLYDFTILVRLDQKV